MNSIFLICLLFYGNVDPAYGSEPLSASDDDLYAILDSAETTRRTSRGSAAVTSRPIPFSAEALRRPYGMTPTEGVVTWSPPSIMPLPPPVYRGPTLCTAATESPSVWGDEHLRKDPSRVRITCLRCKEYSIDCHGPEIKLDGHCSNCHENGKKCEFKSCASDQNLGAPSSSPNPQSSAINDEMLHTTALTNNDNPTNIDIPNPQPNTSSSGRQIDQKTPIIDESRERETSNTTGGITNDHSISSEPRIRPWWKRLFSRIFFSRKDRGAKRKRRS